jgi:hypothetical protein
MTLGPEFLHNIRELGSRHKGLPDMLNHLVPRNETGFHTVREVKVLLATLVGTLPWKSWNPMLGRY